MHNKLKTLIPLFLAIIIDSMGAGLVIPILSPLMMSTHGGLFTTDVSTVWREIAYGVAMGIFTLGMFLGGPILGDISDRIGRRKMLIICLTVLAISYILSAISIHIHDVWLLLVVRFIGGLFAGSQTIAQAAVIDISDDTSKTANLGLISFSMSLGFILGPLLGGILTNTHLISWFGFTTPFWFAGIASTINMTLISLWFKEPNFSPKAGPIKIFKAFSMVMSAFNHKRFKGLCWTFFFMALAWSLYFQFISLYLVQHFQFNSAHIGYFMALMALCFALSSTWLIRKLLTFWNARKITLTGLSLMTLALGVLTLSSSLILQIIAVVVIATGVALAYTSLLSIFSDQADEHSQGWAMGVCMSVMTLGWVITGFSIGIIDQLGAGVLFAVGAICAFTSVMLLVRLAK